MTGEMRTKERLAQELEKLPEFTGKDRLVRRARAGMYDDYESPSATPLLDLVKDLRKSGQERFVQRVINGEFDGTKEEAEAWRRSPEGQKAFLDLLFSGRLEADADRKCPHCGESNIEAQGTRPGDPETGDASLCFYCVQWSVFDAELTLRKPTDEEQEELASDPVAVQAVQMVREVKSRQ